MNTGSDLMTENASPREAQGFPSLGAGRPSLCIALAALPMTLIGCNTPFGEYWGDDYRSMHVPMERLRTIEPVSLEEQSLTPPKSVEEAASEQLQRWTPEAYRADEDTIELTLADVRAAALANNLDLQVALYDPVIAETSVSEEAARFEWTFATSIRHSDADSPAADLLTGSSVQNTDLNFGVRVPLYTGGVIDVNLPMNRRETDLVFSVLDPAYTSDLRFSISQPLLRNAGLRVNTHGIRVARYQQQIVDARTKLESIRILAAADRAYWRLYAAVQELDVRLQQYELAERQLERARRRVEAGEDPEIEVLRAEAGMAERLEAIIIADNIIRQRQRDLKRIINISELPIGSSTRIMLMTEPSPLGIELDPAALADHAVNNRMELLELELQMAIDASNLSLERNQALPLFTLDYTYQLSGLGSSFSDSFDMLTDRNFDGWAVGLSAEIPLGNEAARARINRAIMNRVQRLATRSQRQLAIHQEVFDAVDQLDTTWQRILAARQAAILAGRRLNGEQRQFEVGLRTSTDVLDAAAALADAQLAEIRALADHQIAMIDIAFATGTLLGRAHIDWQPQPLPKRRAMSGF
jgi:outer membrane protein